MEDATPTPRELPTWAPELELERRADGTMIVRRLDPLGEVPPRLTGHLLRWAAETPDRVWLAEREGGDWRRVTYAEGLSTVRSIGQALLDMGLSAERPLLILSGNGIAHALMAVAAQHVGIPSAALAPAYSLSGEGFDKLRGVVAQLTPGLVFADRGAPYAKALDEVLPDVPLAVVGDPPPGREARRYADLAATPPTPAVEAAHEAVGPDTVLKFLFTSGTTGSPKAVIQTHGMISANQEQVADCYRWMVEEPPVLVDWAPWNHTASGNKAFYLVLRQGGTFHIDQGKPAPGLIEETVRNLREVSPTWYFNVPAGYELLVEAMERDPALRESFFARLKIMMYAGAGMARHTWDRLDALARETTGRPILLATALGATETGPVALKCMERKEDPGNVGIPIRGMELKLVPQDDKLEARLRGPNITPGYWRAPDLTAEAFDEEGFYRLGDALRFAEEGDPAAGFFFDGRLAENFKLGTGTWVAVGALRAKLVDDLGGLVRDAVIAGQDREALGALLVPFMPALRAVVPDGAALSDAEVIAHPAARAAVAERLSAHAKAAGGSASRITRAMLLEEPPSFDRGEATDKGSLNQRAMLRLRAGLVEALYEEDPRVIRAED